jgi:hypothetical protein
MMRDYEELFEALKKAMFEKLQENDHKQGFDNATVYYATARIKQELEELLNANTIEEARKEFADIANFCGMGVMACDRELKAREEV